MARLLPFPDIEIISQQPLSGPESVGATQGTSIGGLTQTVASPFGAWVWKFTFAPMTGDEYVHFRGWLGAHHKGANATRWKFIDRDLMSPEKAGVAPPSSNEPWSNGMGWSNGSGWEGGLPSVGVAANAALDTTIVQLDNQFWGHRLTWGQRIGFFPFHFGMYQITEVLGPGRYRIWPPLRRAITSSSYATLYPVMAMRLAQSDHSYPTEEQKHVIGASVTMIEVFDYDVRDYFTD